MSQPLLRSEAERLAALESYDIMDTSEEAVFDDLTRLSARLTETPMALVSLIDAKRQWFKARVGFERVESPRDESFCVHALGRPSELLLVPDTHLDPRFESNPMVTGSPHIRSYAGAPLVTPEGHVLGVLCVLDQVPRSLTTEQQDALGRLARTIMSTLELRRSKRRAEELALTDPLTGLANRRAFFDVLGRAIVKQERDGLPFGLIYLDLDGFKQVNDQAGHAVGDDLLREVAQALLLAVRRDDLVARLGGDEFAVLLSSDNIAVISEMVRQAIGRQMQACGWDVTTSVGAVTFLSPPESEVAATVAADQMMYAAKTEGKNRTRHREMGRRVAPAPPVRDAVERPPLAVARQGTRRVRFSTAGLRTYYQPIMDLRTGVVVGVEALARLWDGTAVLPPSAFLQGLSAAELRALLFGVLDQGLGALARCRRSHPALGLSVNVDPVLLLEPSFTESLLERLEASPIENDRIVLELLENGDIVDQEMTCRQLQRLRDSRLRITLDDVGSGYSSLSRLRNLPIDGMKLDQTFARGLWERPNDLLFVSNMMSLAGGLGRGFVVEGAETAEILDALTMLGVGPAQGYAIARPMTEDAMVEWLAGHVPVPARRRPQSLLGAYAAHLSIVRAMRALLQQPLDVVWLDTAFDPNSCVIGHYLSDAGLYGTPYGLAHKRFHKALSLFQTDKLRWDEAAETLRKELEIAIHHQHHRQASD